MKTLSMAALIVSLSAPIAQASGIDYFTDFVGFGDSLSDKGRFPVQLATIPPQDGSRFSDGPTWMEQLGQTFADRGGANVNMALGGATAGANTPQRQAQYEGAEFANQTLNGPRDPSDPDDIPYVELINFQTQIDSFLNGPSTSAVGGLADMVGSNPLVTVLLGGNDFLGLPDDADPFAFASVGAAVITALETGITAMKTANSKFDDFMVANLPSLTRAPELFYVPDVFKVPVDQAIGLFNLSLFNSMQTLESDLGVNIEIFDLNSAFDDIYAEGLLAGLIADDSCLPGGGVNNCPNPGDSADYLFIDDIHPTSFIQNGIADAALAQVSDRLAPVPVPTSLPLLLAGVGLIVVLRRRHAG